MNQVRHDNKRDERWVTLYNDDALELMSGWTGGQDDPLYAISSSGGANYAWVFADAITNLSSDIAGVKKVGKKYQLGKGTFTKKEIDELYIIRGALVMALEDPESYDSPESVGETRPHLPQRTHIVLRDFTTLPEIIAHAQKEGATHVITGGVHNRIRVYFPHSGQYEEAILWRDGGYWHSPAPSHRAIIVDLPPGAEPIEAYLARSGGQMTERHVRDYIAVDPGGRPVAGPFKDYSEAKKHADRARGHVEFKMGEAVRSSGSRMIRGFHVVDPQGVTLHFDQGYAFHTEAAAIAAIESEIDPRLRSELRIEPCEWSEFSIENWQQRGFKTREAARGKRAPMTWTRQNTKLSTWFERDRAHVDLQTLDDQTIIEWWDEAVAEAVEDGFLNPRDWHGSAVEYANYIGAQAPRAARGSKTREAARKKRAPNDEEIGAQYAQDQVASDYFMDWVRGQIVEAEEMGRREPGSVFPLGTKAAYRKLARNMLQQLEWDTKRQMDTREIHALGASDSKSFFIGFVEELKADNTLNWLADEIETIHKQSVGPEVGEARAVPGQRIVKFVYTVDGQIEKSGRDGAIRRAKRLPYPALVHRVPLFDDGTTGLGKLIWAPKVPQGTVVGSSAPELPEDLKGVIGTLAHNQQFTIADLEQYTRFDRPRIASQAKSLVGKMLKMGYLERTARGHYFPTTAGWAWIEGGASESHRSREMRAAPSADELAEMIAIMEKYGYSEEDARKLSAEGMGPMELEHILKTTRPGEMGSLEYTRRIHKTREMALPPAPSAGPLLLPPAPPAPSPSSPFPARLRPTSRPLTP